MAEILVSDRIIIKISTGAASVETIWQDGASARPGPHKVVEATGPFSFAGLLTAAQAAALAGTGVAQGQVAALTAERDAALAKVAALETELEGYRPTEKIPAKYIRAALAKLKLSKEWDAAVDATLADDKAAYTWWIDVEQITTDEPEWARIVAAMVWGKHSAAELIAEAKKFGAPAEAEAKA